MNAAFWFGVALQLICAGSLVALIVWAVCAGKETPAERDDDVDPWGGPR